MPGTPLVVAVLHASGKDKDYELYCEAYGLEMQIDNEWNADAVLLAPSGHLHAVTKNTDVTGPDTRIVSAGVTDVPLTPADTPDLSEINDNQNNWLLVAGPGNIDTEEVIRTKLRAALDAGCRVILCFSEPTAAELRARLQGIDPSVLGRRVVAYTGPDATQPAGARRSLQAALESLRSVRGMTGKEPRVIVGGRVTATNAVALNAIPGIAGVLLPAAEYGDFGDILKVLAALGAPRRS